MTLLNRLGRLFGGDAAEQGASRQTRDLQLICEQIRQHLAQGGDPARWLAWSVVRGYRPPTLPPLAIGVWGKPSNEALALFERLVMIHSARLPPRQQEWDPSDALIAALVEDCAQHLNTRLEEINENR